MKKVFTFILFCLFSFSIFATVTITKQGDTTSYDFTDISLDTQKVLVEGQSFIKAKLLGVDEFGAIKFKLGMPEIPAVRLYVPAGEVTVQIDDTKGLSDSGKLAKDIVPNLESLEKIPGSQRKLIINKSFQKSNAFYPHNSYEIMNAGTLEGKATLLVTVYPLSWNPASKSYKLIDHFNITVKENQVQKNHDPMEQTFAFIVGGQFKNSPAVLKYENFKKQLGYNVVRIIAEGTMNSPEAIRTKLQELYRSSNLKYALIFGDAEHVPSKRANNISGVTDHYYRAIDNADYESDINGPDIGVGRVTIKNEQELSQVVEKFIKYQTANFSDESWLDNAAFIATDDRYVVAEGSHNFAIDTYMAPRGYMGVFPSAEQLGGDKLYAITYRVQDEQVVSTMNLGRTIINYSGHGGTTVWAGPTVTQEDVRSLNHPNALPFVISNACVTGDFTTDESFGETWIKHPTGAIMYWGSMDSSYWDEDDFLERDMYAGIYDLNNSEFSEITHHALRELWRRYGGENRSKYYWETYVTFGDPSIKLRTSHTQNIILNGPSTIPVGMSNIEFQLTYNDGTSAPNARVVLMQNNALKASGTSDNQGMVKLDIPSNLNPGNYQIKIYGINTKIVENNFTVALADQPLLILSDVVINGQDDLKVNPFEQLAFNFKIKNAARVGTRGAYVSIEKIEGAASNIGEKNVEIPALGSNVSYQYVEDGLKIQIDDAADQERIVVHFKWVTLEGQEGFGKVALLVNRGDIVISSLDYGDIQNPNNGGIRPGTTGDVYLTIKNSGSAIMTNINLYPEIDTCIESINGAVFIDKLAPGETYRATTPLAVTLNNDCQNNQLAKLKLVGSYGSCTQIDLTGQVVFEIGKYTLTSLEQDLSLAIPDQSSITHTFNINSDIAFIKDLGIHIKITHTYVGDIIIKLVHPDGTSIKLRDKEGSDTHNIDDIYGMGGIANSAFENLKNKPANGTWKLIVTDDANNDIGTLTYLNINIKGLMD
ncbi:MAG: hypothetical protein A2202_00710 [Bdellovibrionales bacterium RIFOXYA1_FULL_36_14]|nr:MAG: hypothetical protein A2202_00710 [Bdellovibrionales bacterium RIFOXYA1_FULL_36_14]